MKKKNIIKELRSFLLLWSSQTVSSLGTAMTEYALIVWIYRQAGTASSTTLLTLCSFAPTILFRFAAGAIADRWDKKRIMLLADLFAACGTFSIFFISGQRAACLFLYSSLNPGLSFILKANLLTSFSAMLSGFVPLIRW